MKKRCMNCEKLLSKSAFDVSPVYGIGYFGDCRRCRGSYKPSRQLLYQRATANGRIKPRNDEMLKVYAKRPPGMHVDHIIPISKGGQHVKENTQYLTAVANGRKGNR